MQGLGFRNLGIIRVKGLGSRGVRDQVKFTGEDGQDEGSQSVFISGASLGLGFKGLGFRECTRRAQYP